MMQKEVKISQKYPPLQKIAVAERQKKGAQTRQKEGLFSRKLYSAYLRAAPHPHRRTPEAAPAIDIYKTPLF